MLKKVCIVACRFLFVSLVLLAVASVSYSCKKPHHDESTTPPAKKKGSLLFWINNPAMLSSCGALTIKLSNGQQANITGYYFTAPGDCVNRFGGYFYVEEGIYTYTVASACTIAGGSVTVIGESCNMARIQ